MGDFVFATCLPGLEPALKLEVARTRPELRVAQSRPGLVTFESPRTIAADDAPGSVFARVWGRSIGAASDPASAAAQLAGLGVTRVHAFARDPEARVDLARWQALGPGGAAAIGELVADVSVAPDEPVWLGVHRHDATRPARAGGTVDVEDAPSLAYAKVAEAIAWGGLAVAAGQVALAIGAHGGAFERRGASVRSVDKIAAARGVDRVDWLVVDVGLAPQVMLQEVARLRVVPARGAIFTFRVHDWTFVDELPAIGERLRKLGYTDVRMRHLPSNRNELCAIARSS